MAFTDAGAGNLALHVGDDPVAVRRRRAELEAAAGLGGRSFRYMNQVHGSDVATIVGVHGRGLRAAKVRPPPRPMPWSP